jgi:hypothetical protein
VLTDAYYTENPRTKNSSQNSVAKKPGFSDWSVNTPVTEFCPEFFDSVAARRSVGWFSDCLIRGHDEHKPVTPYRARFVLVVSDLSTERSQYDATFEEATHAWPDYTPYYNHRAWYLMPRWYGTEGEWESDLEKSADQKGGDEGDLLYARVVWYMHQSHSFSNIIKECNLSWPRVDKGFEVMEKRFPSSLAVKSEHAYLAVLARDATVARKQFDQLQGRLDSSVWTAPARFFVFAYWTYSPDHKFPGE